ncbi:sodium-dependent transporter [candidate division KSB1 bacterium]|nr:sodium-dependent transporter [candidate division KSB1 bacterium]
MSTNRQDRGKWGSRVGFIFAAAGSAIGLGNIWRFPYVAGENGGAAFVFLYIIFVIIIGVPVMISELAIGRYTEKNPVGAFRLLAPKSWWPALGMLGVFTGIGILSFYSVVAGWTLGYFVKTILGEFSGEITTGNLEVIYNTFVGNPVAVIIYSFIFISITALVVQGGVSEGIERWAKILMPFLFALLILLTLRSITLEGGAEGIRTYLLPDFSKVRAATFGKALGQALFSLSLGMGTMITYGSYMSKKENLVTAAGYVCFFDTLIAILAGLMIFPAVTANNLSMGEGPGLVFKVIPAIFSRMFGGHIFGAGFFLLLAIAALTSTISLLEVPVAYLVDERHWKRTNAVLLMAAAAFLLSIPSSLSFMSGGFFANIPVLKMKFLAFMNIIMGNYSLAIGSFFIALFVGARWGTGMIRSDFTENRLSPVVYNIWRFLIRFVCPIAILAIFIYIIVSGDYA